MSFVSSGKTNTNYPETYQPTGVSSVLRVGFESGGRMMVGSMLSIRLSNRDVINGKENFLGRALVL